MAIMTKVITTAALDAPITHALIVFMHNKWRKQWELPGGIIETGEYAQQCVNFVRVYKEVYQTNM
ncbi:hypothetical protein MKY42_23525 [Paenibacillus sp. FSL W7-1088]|uniref:hypothetical protein n=1 Tax=Paenibacillus sp. FSL W7-1088 TaxID=2921695 RepID=UPI0030EF27FA